MGQVLERFFRADKARACEERSGLGLAGYLEGHREPPRLKDRGGVADRVGMFVPCAFPAKKRPALCLRFRVGYLSGRARAVSATHVRYYCASDSYRLAPHPRCARGNERRNMGVSGKNSPCITDS